MAYLIKREVSSAGLNSILTFFFKGKDIVQTKLKIKNIIQINQQPILKYYTFKSF